MNAPSPVAHVYDCICGPDAEDDACPERGNDLPAVTYHDRYGDPREATLTDPEYDSADLWEGVDYTAQDTRSLLTVTLAWDESAGWFEVQR